MMLGVAYKIPYGRCWVPPLILASVLTASVSAAELPTKDAGKFRDRAAEAVRDQIADKWTIVSGLQDAGKVHVRITMKLDRSGRIIGKPEVMASGGPKTTRTAIAFSAYRAVMRAAPFANLPFDKSAASIEMVVNFETGGLGY